MVRFVRVEDGQTVKAVEVLIELDSTVSEAERDHLHNDLPAEPGSGLSPQCPSTPD
jgi:hypothetical protein